MAKQAKNRKFTPKPSQPKPQPGNKKKPGAFPWLLFFGILLFTLAIYWQSNQNGFTNWDDDVYVTENALIAKPSDFKAMVNTQVGGNHHPVTMYSLALNYAFVGKEPQSYHQLNLFLHLINTALVFIFIWLLSDKRIWTSVITALFFGIHPMHVESVAWVAERKDVLYTSFFLLSLIFYHRYVRSKLNSAIGSEQKVSWGSMLLCVLFFLLSTLSKPAAVVLPLVMLAVDYFIQRKISWFLLIEKIPLFLISFAIGLWTLDAQKASGAVTDNTQWSLLEKLVFACYGSVMYVVKMILPTHLSAIYPYPNVVGKGIGIEFYLAVPVLLLALVLTWIYFRKNRVVVFGLAFFFLNLILVLQFFTVGQAVMADRYTYVPYIGLFFILSWWLDEQSTPSKWASYRPIALGFFGLFALICAALTYQRCQVWKSTESLWTDTIAKYPRRIVVAYNNLGHHYRQTKELDKALAHYNEALSLNPKYHLAWANKGKIYFDKGLNDSALVCYNKALALKDDLWETYGNRGVVKAKLNDLSGAVEDLTKAVTFNPTYGTGFSNRALVNQMLRHFDQAKGDYQKVIDLDPQSPDNHRFLNAIGLCEQQLRQFKEAIGHFNTALGFTTLSNEERGIYYLNRSYAYNGLGDKATTKKDLALAQQFGQKVDPAYVEALGR